MFLSPLELPKSNNLGKVTRLGLKNEDMTSIDIIMHKTIEPTKLTHSTGKYNEPSFQLYLNSKQ